MEKPLLNLKEFCAYLGIGQSKARQIVNDGNNDFSVRIGNRIYVHKQRLDEYLDRCSKYQISI